MGFLNALLDSADRFRDDLLPLGYEWRRVRWIVDVAADDSGEVRMIDRGKDAAFLAVPMRGDRTGTPSKSNLKPSLLVDKATYALGLDADDRTAMVYAAFLDLHQSIDAPDDCDQAKAMKKIVVFLGQPRTSREAVVAAAKSNLKSDDVVAYRCGDVFQHDLPWARQSWKQYLEQHLCEKNVAACSLCGELHPTLRILPYSLRLFGQSCPIIAVNTKEQPAFASREKEQLANAPTCFECIGTVQQVLQHLVRYGDNGVGRNAIVLARDDSPKNTQPLRNQLAVFWTKRTAAPALRDDDNDDDRALTGAEAEDAARTVMEPQEVPADGPPPEDGQMRDLLRKPWSGGKAATSLQDGAFFFAVLSPNKSRLVLREWMELGVEQVRGNLADYVSAARIIHPELGRVWFPPLPALLDALHPPKSDKASGDGRRENDPHLLCDLLRCAFRGESPPMALLAQAVQRFAVPDREKEDRKNVLLRRMNLAAAMKLCLTHKLGPEEQHAMEQLDERRRKPAYLCGRLLAVLDEVQRQYHRPNTVNTTLADRFYGTASTAPASVFANLMNIATKAHLPKLRRERRGVVQRRKNPDTGKDEFVWISDKLEEVCAALDDAGGFPPPLEPKDQAEFGLGFYHQRAKFKVNGREARVEAERKRTAASVNSTDSEGSAAS